MVEHISIKVKKPTHEKLRQLARYGETMDGIISKCIEALIAKERRKV